jgi:epoxyqueuosine reductase
VTLNKTQLISSIQTWALDSGFSRIGVSDVDLSSAEPGFLAWLDKGFHGDMHYMQKHGLKRVRPAELVPGTIRVITVSMNYLPANTPATWQRTEFSRLNRPDEAIVSMYARGRDYHKVMRGRLQQLSARIAQEIGPFGHRVFVDSAPVMETELAAKSGQGWRGKHTLILNREAGSMFFLGEIYIDFDLPLTPPAKAHCGTCTACMDVCPTQAIVGPYRLDARRCISYLTIEHAGSIPIELRPLMGNRIYGCDDCQLICPWNKFAKVSTLPDFDVRKGLTGSTLCKLFLWTEDEFSDNTHGSPIHRIGHIRWLRNLAVAMGNVLRHHADPAIVMAVKTRLEHSHELVREHVQWALEQDKYRVNNN